MKLPSFPRMIIEIKKDDEVFEKFDKNTIILRLVFWKEGLKSIKTTDLDYERYFIDQTETISYLVIMVAQKYNIPIEKVRIFKKDSLYKDSFTFTELSDEDN